MLVTGNSSDIHPKGRYYQGFLTFTLADRHSTRLEAVFTSQPTSGEMLGALREFELAYRQELRVCLTCSVSVILMATKTQVIKLPGGSASEHVHEAPRHPVPRALWVLSIFYAALGILLYLSASQLLCYAFTSAERAESWRQNALRVRWLPAKLSAPHVFSAWAVVFFVACLFAQTIYSVPADEHEIFYCKLSKALLLSVLVIAAASVVVAVHCHRAFERLGRFAVAA